MNTVLPLLLAPAVSAIAAGLEHAPAIPYQAKNKASITAVLLGLSLAVRVGIAAYQGQLDAIDLSQEIELLKESALTALAAAGGYSLVKAEKPLI